MCTNTDHKIFNKEDAAVTIKEIAELAGTSRGTVDRVLNNRGKVSAEIEKRVREVAEREGYQPNQLARALINSRKHLSIGVVINSVGNPFFGDVLQGVRDRAAKLSNYGMSLTIREIKGYNGGEQIEAVKELLDSGIDGLALTPVDVPEVRKYLKDFPVPIVTFNTDIDVKKLAFVGCNYYNSGRISGDLAKLILDPEGGTAASVIGSFNIGGHKKRVEGFEDCVASAENIKIADRLENQDDDDISYEIVSKLLRDKAPDLIYFGAAGIEGGIQAVLDSGRIVKILTVDDTEPVKKYLKKGIVSATVTQQPYMQGKLAIKILYDYLATGKPPREVNCFMENQVKLRSSK